MSAAAIEREFVSAVSPTMPRAGAGGRPCQGVYHRPAGRRPTTAVIATHYDIDFSEHYLADHVAALGHGFLGWNTRYRGDGAHFILHHALIDIGVGVRWLREQAGVERVVILGNSGGASLMGAYQSQATSPSVRAPEGMRLPEAVLDLPRGDAFVSLCAHRGRPDVLTSWLDPSVVDETDPVATDPDLDMFNPDNGPPYSAEFVARYRAAQERRNRRITAWVKQELARVGAAGVGDRMFSVHREWADLRWLDLTLDANDRAPGCYLGDARRANSMPFGIAISTTLRTWLSMWSLDDSQCRAEPHLRVIGEPALVIQSTADEGCFPSDAAEILDWLGSRDKTLEMVPGDHYLRRPESLRPQVAALIADWMGDRGM